MMIIWQLQAKAAYSALSEYMYVLTGIFLSLPPTTTSEYTAVGTTCWCHHRSIQGVILVSAFSPTECLPDPSPSSSGNKMWARAALWRGPELVSCPAPPRHWHVYASSVLHYACACLEHMHAQQSYVFGRGGLCMYVCMCVRMYMWPKKWLFEILWYEISH